MTPPALDLLLGPTAPGVLAPVLAEYRGELCALDPVSATVRPSGSAVVRYRAAVRRGDGTRSAEVLVAATGEAIPAGAAVVAGKHRGDEVEVGIWRWPQDPALPGIALLDDPVAALRALGLRPAGPVRVTVRAYRPGQRAVVEVGDGGRTWFVKVVRPDAVAGLRARHELLAAHVPVPPVLASSDDGVIVLPEACGTPVRALIARGGALPEPARLDELLEALPPGLMAMPRRRGQLERVGDTAAVLGHTVSGRPDLSDMVSGIVERLKSASPQSTPVTPVHGDFYEGQLLAENGCLTGLLDVDIAGPGERADDWATFIGHLSVAGRTTPRAREYADQALEFACRRVGANTLRYRIAAVVFGLATGPLRTLHPRWPELTAQRLALARTWLER
ncbi:phosphotransferase family protein [Mycobacterium sp. NAZ190054]|uniref:phosphotransferase family protein n=1 Tax=Mycobacterium sp. NAZ190054 TaxID=1747766 RepID=UPI0007930A11|nr:phosphotransferase [Mycobacterium sp. NAZ190054]KWX66413.1 hypothetical protein ASJ79_06145 [Mycobacterium sp. NAZ190054]